MKLSVSLLSIPAIVFLLGACDRHSFEETKVLHAKYQDHGDHAGHADSSHGDKAGHAEKPGHGADAGHGHETGHGDKKAAH